MRLHMHRPTRCDANGFQHFLVSIKPFSFITMNRRKRFLVSDEIIVSLDADTRTRNDLSVRAELDGAQYSKGQAVCQKDCAAIQTERHAFHGKFNCCIRSGVT
jgi:hypothetical protein